MTAVTYVYALIRPLPYPATTLPVPGMDGADVRVVNEPEIAALVSSVDAETFSAGALRDGINDLQWLERAARTHDSVIDSAINMTTAIPLRLGTTCPDDGSVAALLRDLRPAAMRTFKRLDGRREWGVQVFARPYTAAGDDAAADESGAGFLRRRRDELRRLETGQAADTAAAAAIYDAARAACAAAQRHAVQDDRLRGDGRRMVLNAVFLVDVGDEESFLRVVRAAAATLGDDRLTITGPWAPYSFAELDGS